MILWCFIVEKKHRRVHPQKKNPKFKTRANSGRNCWVLGWPFRSSVTFRKLTYLRLRTWRWWRGKRGDGPTLSSEPRRDVHRTVVVGRDIIPKDELIDIGVFFFFEDEFGVFKMHELIDDFEEMSQHLRSTCMRNHQIMMKHDDETWWWNIVMDHDLKITPLMAMFCDFQSGLLGRHSETQ